MAKKNTYLATIKYEEGIDTFDVDMLNLPYDMFGPKFPLEIYGDVDMGKCKGQDLPDMSNVIIRGAFDCSTCTITQSSVLPREITELVCKHSVNSLDVLVNKLPESVRKIVIRTAIFSSIKESAKKTSLDKTVYENALRFMDLYPNITVTDGKKTLSEVVQGCQESVVEKKPVVPHAVVTESLPELQSQDWLSVNELVVLCESELSPEVLKSLDKDLKRYIRQAMAPKSNIKIETREMRRADGTLVKCVRKEDVVRIIEYISQSMSQKKDVASQPEKNKKTEEKKSDVPASKSSEKKYYIGNREVKTIKIKKYISKAAWGQVLSKVGKNINALRDILQDIENINVNPALAHAASGQVLFVKDDQLQVSPTVGFKNGRCLAQGFGTLDDRPRIVWGICGDMFVCQNFYPAHEGKVKLEYNALLRTIDIDASKLDLSEYLLVSDLIDELSVPRPVPTEEKKTESMTEVFETSGDVAVKVEPTIQDVKEDDVVEKDSIESTISDTPIDVSVKPDVTVVEPKKTRVIKNLSEVTRAGRYKKKMDVVKKESDIAKPKLPRWASLYYINGKLSAEYRMVVLQQQELLNALTGDLDTDQMLKQSQRLCSVLEKKQKLEAALKAIEEKNQELFEFIKQIDIKTH